MKLYTFDPAPNPQRLTLFMKYKGIEIETHQVDWAKEEHLSDEYRAIVPDGTVPSLVLDDGTVLSEVVGICTYLEALYPEKPMMGTSALEKAQVISWDHKLFNMVFIAIAEALRNATPAFADRALPGPLNVPQIPDLVTRGKMRLNYAWEALDKTVPSQGFLAGAALSLADIDMMVCAGFSGWVKCAPPEELTRLHAYLRRVGAELG